MGIMGLSEIMDKSVDILRKYIKSLVLFTLGYGIIAFLAVFIVIIAGAFLAVFAAGISENIVLTIVVISLLALVVASFCLSYQAGIIKIACQEYIGEKVDTYKAIGVSFKSIFKIMGVVLLAVLMFLPVVGVYLAITHLINSGINSTLFYLRLSSMNAALVIVLAIAVVLLIYFIFLAYFTWFSFVLQALIIEKKGIFGSVKRSFKLVRRSFWRILGCIVLFYLTVSAVNLSLYSFIALVASIIYLILRLLSVQPDFITFFSMALTYLEWPMNILSWLIVSPIGTSMLTLLYFNQRYKKDGYDLLQELRRIQKNDERKQTSEAAEFNGAPQN